VKRGSGGSRVVHFAHHFLQWGLLSESGLSCAISPKFAVSTCLKKSLSHFPQFFALGSMAMSIADSCQLILFVGSRCRNGAVVSSRFRPLHASSFVCWRFFLLNLPPSQICIPNHGMETPSSGLYTNFFASFQGNICVSIFCLFLCFIQCIIYIL
jgi:hypothetical protein